MCCCSGELLAELLSSPELYVMQVEMDVYTLAKRVSWPCEVLCSKESCPYSGFTSPSIRTGWGRWTNCSLTLSISSGNTVSEVIPTSNERKRGHSELSEEDIQELSPKRKKIQTTSSYIYNTLFRQGVNSDITIHALGACHV